MTQPTDKSNASESEFLRAEAEIAKAQIHQSLNDAKAAFAQSMDLRPLARKHPWVSIASAATAGFVAAAIAVPSKYQSELRRLEQMHRATHPDPTPPPTTNGSDKKPTEKEAWGTVLLKEIIQIIRPILMAAITANIKGGANSPAPEPPPPPVPQGPDNTL